MERGEELQVLMPRPLSGIVRTTVVTHGSEPRTSSYDRECIRGWRERIGVSRSAACKRCRSGFCWCIDYELDERMDEARTVRLGLYSDIRF